MDKVRLGVIGCGGMCGAHLKGTLGEREGLAEDLHPFADRTEIRGLADVDLSKAQAYQETYGGDYATTDVDRLFNDPEVDAVLIATWHDTHGPLSLRAIEAGKHVLIEKPMVMTEQECDDVLGALDAHPEVKYMVAFRSRFGMGAQAVKREIPHPDNIICHARISGIWPETSWAQDPIKGGGQILSQGCHPVDMMFYLAGAEPETVYAVGGTYHHASGKVVDTINATIRFDNGSVGAFLGGDGGSGNLFLNYPLPCGCPFFVMVVDKGRSAIAIDHGHDARFQSCVDKDVWVPPFISRVNAQDYGEAAAGGVPNILPTFTKCLVDDLPLPATAKDGARTTRFILRCFESARTGKIIKMT